MRLQACNLLSLKLKGEFEWEAVGVAFDLLVEPLGGDAIERGQIRIKDDPLAAEDQDPLAEIGGARQSHKIRRRGTGAGAGI